MRYLFTNEILDAVLSATNGDSNYPVANLQDRFLQKRFQSTGEISQITSLMNTVADMNCIAQGHTNATTIYSYLYGAGQGIYQAYTNLVTDQDLSNASLWIPTNINVTDSGQIINGEILWKLEAITASPSGLKLTNFTDLNGDSFFGLILKKGNTNSVRFLVTGILPTGLDCTVTFSTKNIVFNASIGNILNNGEIWVDDETLYLPISVPTTATTGTPVDLWFYEGAPSAGDYYYVSQPILVDNTTTVYPFVSGTHSADVVNENFTMPDKFAIRLKIDPKFAYTDSVYKRMFRWYIDSTHRFRLLWNIINHVFNVHWQDGGTNVSLDSQVFDDGSVDTKLNQKLDFVIFIDLISGNNTSMFVSIPQESGIIHTDNIWNGIPDIRSSIFSILDIGNLSGANQADSDIESLQVYEWDGVKPAIFSSLDADNYFDALTPSFEFEPDSVLFKESVVHNLNSDTDMTYFDKTSIKQIVTTIEGPDPVYLGGIGAGEYYQMPDPEEAFSLPLRDNSHYEQSPSGQVLSNYEKPLEALEWMFKGITNDVANEIRSEYIEIGKGYPFYADFFENNRDFYSPLYCFFLAEPGDQKNSRRRDYTVELLEAR